MNTTSTRTAGTFSDMAHDDRFLGFGYIGGRRHFTQWEARMVAEADAAILEATADWTDDELFTWANSKDGRWFADEAFGMRSLPRAMRYLRKQA